MTRPDDHDDVLHHALDPGTVDRLLRGELAPQDTPPELSDAASLIRAARGPACADELIDRAGSVDALVGAGLRRSRGDSRGGNASSEDEGDDDRTVDLRRATRLPGPVRSVLLGLLAAAALAGAAGAATGAIPIPGLSHRDEPVTTLPPSPDGVTSNPADRGGNDPVLDRRSPERDTTSTTTAAPDGATSPPGAEAPTDPSGPPPAPTEAPSSGAGSGDGNRDDPAPGSPSGGGGNGTGGGNGSAGGNGASPPGQGAGSSNPNAGGTSRNANAPAVGNNNGGGSSRNANAPAVGTNNAGGNPSAGGDSAPNGKGAGSANPDAG